MPLAIFDLDETLLAGDSDHLWCEFLVEKGMVDREHFLKQDQVFYQQYKEGRLDVHAYLRFALSPMKGLSASDLKPLQDEFLAKWIEPLVLPKGEALIAKHRSQGHDLILLTATNEIITRPIAARLQMPVLIASEVGWLDGRMSGEASGDPSFREGKVRRLNAWMAENGKNLKGSVFYSDSRNDLPLLAAVERAVAVDPDAELRKTALERGWEIISLR